MYMLRSERKRASLYNHVHVMIMLYVCVGDTPNTPLAVEILIRY